MNNVRWCVGDTTEPRYAPVPKVVFSYNGKTMLMPSHGFIYLYTMKLNWDIANIEYQHILITTNAEYYKIVGASCGFDFEAYCRGEQS